MQKEITVLFFASLKDRAGVKKTSLELAGDAKVKDLKTVLKTRFPDLEPALASTLVSVNQEFAMDDDNLPDGAEVALFPPVSGGCDVSPDTENDGLEAPETVGPTFFTITEHELDLNALLAKITLPSTGAACFFTGMVRAETHRGTPHSTAYLEYEAYKPMAEAKMRQVAEEIRQRWPNVEGIAVVQRIGRLDPGTPTVMIACTAAHRDTGVFAAARYGIDRLKEIVPVWKKEVGPQGESWVEGDYHPQAGE